MGEVLTMLDDTSWLPMDFRRLSHKALLGILLLNEN